MRNLCKNKSNKNFCNYFEVSETSLFCFQFHNLCAWTWKRGERRVWSFTVPLPKEFTLIDRHFLNFFSFLHKTLAQSSKFGWAHFEDNAFKNIRFCSYENKLCHAHFGICRLENANLLFSKILEMLWTWNHDN